MTTVHIVPHTHWDREWYEPFQVFRMRLVHLIDSLLGIFERDPGFTFFTLDGQTIILKDYLAARPRRRDDLAQHIAEGRLLVGPWYVLPDEFLVSPEALVRNLLRGAALCAEFGGRMPVGYIPDPFGHIGQMPQILRGFGIETACLERGLADHPCELHWQAPDGSSVLTANLRDGYDNAARMPTQQAAFDGFVRQRVEDLQPHSRCSHFLLMNGTDHHEAQAEIAALAARTGLREMAVCLSTLPTYLQAIRGEIAERSIEVPTVRGELRSSKRHHLLPGVLSSRTWIKQRNHACEAALERWAEPFSSWAELLCGDAPDRSVWTGHLTSPRLQRPADLLRQAWDLLLECQPHDSICGCSIDQVHEEMRTRFDQVDQVAAEIIRQSLTSLADLVDVASAAAPGARAALVIFNAASTKQSGLVRACFELPAGLDPFEIHAACGDLVPYRLLHRRSRELADLELDRDGLQGMISLVEAGRVMGLAIQAAAAVAAEDRILIDVVVSESGDPDPEALSNTLPEVERLAGRMERSIFRLRAHFATEVEIELLASDVPALGYTTLTLSPSGRPRDAVQEDAERFIENSRLRVEVDEAGLVTLLDRPSGNLYPDLLRFSDQADRGDSYTFCPVDGDGAMQRPSGPVTVKRVRDRCGQRLHLAQTYRLPLRLNPGRESRSDEAIDVPILARLELSGEAGHVRVQIGIDNQAEDHRLQVLFPLGAPVSHGVYAGHFETVHRPTSVDPGGEEWIEQPQPQQPMRGLILVGDGQRGLGVAARGLYEGSVSADGVIAVTLLRAFGWLSRDDLSSRRGGAGPQLPTPGGQCLGRREFELLVFPWDGDEHAGTQTAEAFQTGLRAAGTSLHGGTLPHQGAFLSIEGQGFCLTAVKTAEAGDGLIVRGYNTGAEPTQITIAGIRPIQRAILSRLDEAPLGPLHLDSQGRASLHAGPHAIVTARLTF